MTIDEICSNVDSRFRLAKLSLVRAQSLNRVVRDTNGRPLCKVFLIHQSREVQRGFPSDNRSDNFFRNAAAADRLQRDR